MRSPFGIIWGFAKVFGLVGDDVATDGAILLEIGDFLLLETGDKLLLE